MLDWKKWMLSTHYGLSTPLRRLQVSKLSRAGHAPMMILFYHRVADEHPNEWTIPNALFQNQMEWIRDRFEIVSLSEIQNRMRSGSSDRPSVSITFDDGYADNVSQALPFLIRNNIPCTYFVTLENITTGKPFPHDAAVGIPLHPNTVEQIRYLSDAGIEIGAHSRTHSDLGNVCDRDMLRDEIAGVKPELESIIAKEVRYFAFPFGLHENLTNEGFSIAHQAGYHGVCSAYGAYNFPDNDPFHLQRIHGDAEMLRLKNWLTYDCRKLIEPTFVWDRDVSTVQESASAIF